MPSWGERAGRHLSFDVPQRRALVFLLTLLIGYGVYRRWTNPAYIDAPQPVVGDRANELADKLDPNTATAADLSALPGVGDKMAAAIVVRRERVRDRDGDPVAFKSIDDLLYVPRIGTAMVEQLRPFLTFPTGRPTTDKSRTEE